MSVVGTYLIGEYRRRGVDVWYNIELKVDTGAAMFHPIYSTCSICTEYCVVDGNRQTVGTDSNAIRKRRRQYRKVELHDAVAAVAGNECIAVYPRCIEAIAAEDVLLARIRSVFVTVGNIGVFGKNKRYNRVATVWYYHRVFVCTGCIQRGAVEEIVVPCTEKSADGIANFGQRSERFAVSVEGGLLLEKCVEWLNVVGSTEHSVVAGKECSGVELPSGNTQVFVDIDGVVGILVPHTACGSPRCSVGLVDSQESLAAFDVIVVVASYCYYLSLIVVVDIGYQWIFETRAGISREYASVVEVGGVRVGVHYTEVLFVAVYEFHDTVLVEVEECDTCPARWVDHLCGVYYVERISRSVQSVCGNLVVCYLHYLYIGVRIDISYQRHRDERIILRLHPRDSSVCYKRLAARVPYYYLQPRAVYV